jgi:hypothetical protein
VIKINQSDGFSINKNVNHITETAALGIVTIIIPKRSVLICLLSTSTTKENVRYVAIRCDTVEVENGFIIQDKDYTVVYKLSRKNYCTVYLLKSSLC